MKRMISTCFVVIALASCGSGEQSGDKQSAAGQDAMTTAKSDSAGKAPVKEASAEATSGNSPAWADSLVIRYIGASNGSLDPKKTIYMYDRTEKRDSVSYLVYSIGQDDGENAEKKFTVGAWLYLDSAAHVLYTYDVVEDKLTRWGK